MADPDQTHHPDEIRRRLIDWAAAQADVRAMLLTSTRARPGAPADRFSDYDVILVVEDIAPYVADRRWIADFGEVLVTYWDPVYPAPGYGIDIIGNVIQYADGLKIDFTVWPVTLMQQIAAAPELLPELDAGYTVLLDKDGLTRNCSRLPSRLRRRRQQKTVPVTEEFLSDVPYVAKFSYVSDGAYRSQVPAACFGGPPSTRLVAAGQRSARQRAEEVAVAGVVVPP